MLAITKIERIKEALKMRHKMNVRGASGLLYDRWYDSPTFNIWQTIKNTIRIENERMLYTASSN